MVRDRVRGGMGELVPCADHKGREGVVGNEPPFAGRAREIRFLDFFLDFCVVCREEFPLRLISDMDAHLGWITQGRGQRLVEGFDQVAEQPIAKERTRYLEVERVVTQRKRADRFKPGLCGRLPNFLFDQPQHLFPHALHTPPHTASAYELFTPVNNSPTPVIIGSFSSYSTEFSTHFSPTSFLSVPGKPGWLARVIGREGKELHYTVLTAPMSRKNGIERKDVVRRVLNFFFQDCKRKNSRRRSVRVACRFLFALTPLQGGVSRGGQRAAAGAPRC